MMTAMTMATMMMTEKRIIHSRLRLLVSVGEGEPRVFELPVDMPQAAMGDAVTAGADAFGAAFNAALKVSRRAPARRAVKKRKSAMPLINP